MMSKSFSQKSHVFCSVQRIAISPEIRGRGAVVNQQWNAALSGISDLLGAVGSVARLAVECLT